jgi:DNA replication protein DnaC
MKGYLTMAQSTKQQAAEAALTAVQADPQWADLAPTVAALVALNPIDAVQRELADLRTRCDKRGQPYPWEVKHLAAAEQAERLAQLRAVVATRLGRPADCWCLGLRDPRCSVQAGTGYGAYWHEYWCPCPDGQAAHQAAQARAYRRLEAAAAIPPRFRDCTLESYPQSEATRPVLGTLRAWLEGSDEVTEYRPGLYLHGPVGVGKTGLAVALMKTLMREIGEEGLFLNLPQLLARRKRAFGKARDDDDAEALWERALTVPILVIDDLAAEYSTDWAREQVYTLVDARHAEEATTIVTSNLTLAELVTERGEERIAWRLAELCDVVCLDGPNLRDRKARARPDVLTAVRAVVEGLPEREEEAPA